MAKKTIFLIVTLVIITFILLFVALSLTPKTPPKEEVAEQPTESQTVLPTPVAHTELSLSPSNLKMTSSSATVEAIVNSNDNQLTAVQLEMSYDPAVLTAVTVTPSTFFPSPFVLINNVDTKTGDISYALAVSPGQDAVKNSSGSVAKISFRVLPGTKAKTTTITLKEKSLATAKGQSASVLKPITTGSVIITLP